jgi:hypothetical protein
MTLSKYEREQAIKFQDAIGEIIDQYLVEGMDTKVMKSVLLDEAEAVEARREDLEEKKL